MPNPPGSLTLDKFRELTAHLPGETPIYYHAHDKGCCLHAYSAGRMWFFPRGDAPTLGVVLNPGEYYDGRVPRNETPGEVVSVGPGGEGGALVALLERFRALAAGAARDEAAAAARGESAAAGDRAAYLAAAYEVQQMIDRVGWPERRSGELRLEPPVAGDTLDSDAY